MNNPYEDGLLRAAGIRGPEDLESRPGFVLRYAADEFRIYELTP